ncbi:malonate decarboxylase holo-[acyl-carrier-protein] synthase [Sphingomonas aurantiaca]|jgi:phosphoribosyl-dephospho-CoA transferase|uniref:Phosphoribosyl-dephospho-CoA transferase n=1 Tax=Sphingomonas aurantiaca TaxID=185949 RepID=A0A2T5GIY4_9SPHN|nr:malonate decarboxylase holo-[acyl-carrier-protein] synthase [Sphingomonas aurantiaca]PTQ59271.1 phosphoribosyl-dephospho-CoA transferase [Sphingomonas aurantiaca]
MRFDRHRLVYLDSARWTEILGSYPALREIPMVVDWVAAGYPLIARRPLCDEGAGLVPLGLPLPPSLGKQRLALAVPPEAILSDAPPPLLGEAAQAAPAAWQRTIDALGALDPDTRCFGSLAWAHLTGLPYLSETSDLDFVWQVACADNAARLVAALVRIEADAPMRLDGEIVTPTGFAVQWREYASDATELLAKAADGNRMIGRGEMFA